ncbi:chemotaxis protein CheW [Acidovorax sp. SUPP3434]|uniref:chemotaxis protein CheW n=1 Tax=Acidovorax sp. SUPP3434 TaxID=2920880 RepID=UPI0023DE5817|nr:chemotaxis protein CheW [Acidovorax sp. SUPP3434]GKT00873.1 chemotaxis protein CheW [Acidovorax sp. SUPP3434]
MALSSLPTDPNNATAANAVSKGGEFLSFRLGDEEYGIGILQVQEIRSYEPPTRLAGAPDFIKGVVNLRGIIIPIVDLRLRLHCASAEYNHSTVVIVLNVGQYTVGAVVDAVSDVVELKAEMIRPAPQLSSSVDAQFILGLGSVNDRMLILVDIEGLVGSETLGRMRPTHMRPAAAAASAFAD